MRKAKQQFTVPIFVSKRKTSRLSIKSRVCSMFSVLDDKYFIQAYKQAVEP